MSYQIARERLAQHERKILERLVAQNRSEVEAQLNAMGRRLFYLSQEDGYRLLNLKWWAEKYAVDLGLVVQILTQYFSARFKGKRQNKKVGFGVRVATLTGKMAEVILQNELRQWFPEDEQHELRDQQRRWQLLDERQARQNGEGQDDGVQTRTKTLMDFDYPSQYVRYYGRRVREQRKLMDREMAKKSNRRFPYRGSPWL